MPGHIVRRLIKGSEGRIIAAEVFETATGQMVAIHADHFVMAAGWLYNAQLLWASDIPVLLPIRR